MKIVELTFSGLVMKRSSPRGVMADSKTHDSATRRAADLRRMATDRPGPTRNMISTRRFVPDVRVALGPVYGGSVDEVAALAADAARDARHVGLVGSAHLPYPLYAALASRLPGLRPADPLLASVRLAKSDEEIGKMRQAGSIADLGMTAIFAPGDAAGPDDR